MARLSCAHCGLPVTAPAGAAEPLFCCYGCALVSRIVGRQVAAGDSTGRGGEGVQAWAILRLGVGGLLAMNVMMISLLLYTGTAEPEAVPLFRWIMLGLAAPAMAILGYPFAVGAAREVSRRRLSLDALIAVGSLAAFAASAAATICGRGEVYFDTATMLPALVTFGKLIEATAKSRAGRLVHGLETLLPATAARLGADGPRDVPLADLRPGDRLRVRPGERFPADGRIVEGTTLVEESAFTGESKPRPRGPGDEVIAGTVNGEGPVLIRAERVGEELLLRRIIEMVEEARDHASPSERIAERAAAAFVPAVLVLAAGAGAFWFWAGGAAQAGLAALAVLVVACPCAMGIAAPLATALAIGRAASEGVIVRGGDVMERIGRLDVIFFDKTGTVTVGRPRVRAVESLDAAVSPDELLEWLAGLESASEHPSGRAVVGEARRRGLAIGAVTCVTVAPGLGARGTVERGGRTHEIPAGTEAFISAGGEPAPVVSDTAPLDGDTVIYVAWDGPFGAAQDGRRRGRVLLADAVRPDAAEAVRRLQEASVATVLLSGDRASAARSVAAEVGIAEVEAPRRPDEKVEVIRAAGREGRPASPRRSPPMAGRAYSAEAPASAAKAGSRVGMVGDGINDAPALAAADVGFALGAGTDLARQAGNVVLLSDRLAQIPWLVALSRRTRQIIRQNLLWAFGYNALALGAAAAGWLHPLLAALAMVFSSVTVLANSLRLRRLSGG